MSHNLFHILCSQWSPWTKLRAGSSDAKYIYQDSFLSFSTTNYPTSNSSFTFILSKMPSSLKMSFAALQLLSLFSTTLAINTRHSNPTSSSSCRTMPGDASWPNSQAWAKLNSTINGRLIATVPLASVCHDPNYDEAACAALAATWSLPQTQ